MQKVLITVLLGLFTSCSKRETSTAKESSLNTNLLSVSKEELYQQKILIDSLFSQKRKQVIVLVKIPNKDILIEVINEKWPDEIETTYNILTDSAGKVIRISEFPYSESGDWNIMYSHYFDDKGKTFAYERRVSAFNTFCPGDDDYDKLTKERIIKLYSPEHEIVDSVYKLTDEQDVDITHKKCQQEVETVNQVFRNVQEYTTNKKIKTANN